MGDSDETDDDPRLDAEAAGCEGLAPSATAASASSDPVRQLQSLVLFVDRCLQLHYWLKFHTWELTGLTLKQALLLCHIRDLGPETYAAVLGREMRRAPGTLAPMLTVLEKEGLVSRRPASPGQKPRCNWIGCTPLGISKVDLFCEHVRELLGPALSPALGDTEERLSEAGSILRSLLSELPGSQAPGFRRGR